MKTYVKSPLNYIGGKYKLLPQILPLFPHKINCFVDLFTGGCNIGINAEAAHIISNDSLIYLIDLFVSFQDNSVDDILDYIDMQIAKYRLSQTNQEGFLQLRESYNCSNRNPLDLFILVAYSFNHQIRFNSDHKYNNPFGRLRSSFNDSMRNNLIQFIEKLHKQSIHFSCLDFSSFDFSVLSRDDFVYCDPPYLITTGTYNDGKRGFEGWDEKKEKSLLNQLDELNQSGIKFALSNVLSHKGNENWILQNWIQKRGYLVQELSMNYSNSNYQTKNRDRFGSREALITNYQPDNRPPQLFDL